jgi:cytochrome c
MRNHRDGNVTGTSVGVAKLRAVSGWLVVGFGVALGACTPTPTRGFVSGSPPTESTGAGGSTFVGSVVDMGTAGDVERGDSPACISTDGGGSIPAPTGTAGMAGSPFTPTLATSVTHAATPVPPISGGTLLALADGVTVVAADPERDQVSFVDFGAGKVTAKVALQPGDEPGRAVEDAAGLVHVALRRGGAVVSIDPVKGVITTRRAVCSAPRGIAYDANTDLLHVACAGGELVSLPAAGGAATRTLMLDRDLRDVVVGSAGKLLVSTFRRADVLVVGADGTVVNRVRPASGMVLSNAGPQTRSPAVAWRMVPYSGSIDGVVMLHQTGVDSVVDPVAGGYGGLKGCGAIAQAGISLLASEGSPMNVAGGFDMVSLAVDVAMSPDGKTAAIAVPGNSDAPGMPVIVTTDVTTASSNSLCNEATTVAVSNAGGAASSVAIAGQVVAVSYAKDGTLLAQTREPSAVVVVSSQTAIALATDSRDDSGHDIFHVNAGGGLACASCHPEGGEDGRVWNFACLGARRTQSIRGGISQTAPFHWDGSEPTFSHLMDDVFSGRMSGPMLSDDQKTALQRWVDTIPAMPVTAGLDAAAVARGKTLFADPTYACATCHAGTLLTNNATVDVGTGAAFQVPSLRGVAWRAPYMHTGCAATLADRFGLDASCDGGDKHGVTSSLSATQVGDMVAYLQSL